MNRLTFPLLFGLLFLASCAGAIKVAPPRADHPASPAGEAAPPAAVSSTLVQEPQDSVRTGSPDADKAGVEHPGHATVPDSQNGEPGMHHGQHGTSTGTGTGAHSEVTTPGSLDVYTCPMHPKMVARQPGKCPLCGMKLIKKKEEHK